MHMHNILLLCAHGYMYILYICTYIDMCVWIYYVYICMHTITIYEKEAIDLKKSGQNVWKDLKWEKGGEKFVMVL